MKGFIKYLFVVILLFNNLLCFSEEKKFAEEKLNLKGYVGSELSILSKESKIIPDMKIRLSFLDTYRMGLRFSWNGKVIIYTGNITFSGTVSALKNPDFSLVLSPLGNASFSAIGISSSLPAYSGSVSPWGFFASCSLGIKAGSTFQFVVTEKNQYYSAFSIPFRFGKILITSSTVLGLYQLPSTLPEKEDSWFNRNLPYDKCWSSCGAEEIRIRTKSFRSQLMTGFFTSPFGAVDSWIRLRGIYNIGFFSIDSGFYCGDSDIVSSSATRIKSSLQFFVTPQIRIVLTGKNGSYIKFGVSFASDEKKEDFISDFFTERKIRFGSELSLPMFRLRLFAGQQTEKYTGDVELLFRNLPFDMNFAIDVSGVVYPKNDDFFNKSEVCFNISATPYGKLQMASFCFIPATSIKTTATFCERNFDSISTEVAASWAYRTKFLTMRGKLAIIL